MARIIEAKAVISAEDRTGAVFDKIARKFKDVGKSAKVSAEIDRMNRSLKGAQDTLKDIDRYRADRGAFYETRKRMQETRAAAEQAAKALAATAKPTREQEQGLRRLERAAEDATRAFERQKAAVLSSRNALTQGGVAVSGLIREHDRLGKVIDRTNAAIKRQNALSRAESGLADGMSAAGRREHARIARDRYLTDGMSAAGREARERRAAREHSEAEARADRRADRREAGVVLGAGAAVVAGHHGKHIAKDAITSAAEFDLAVRKQRAFTDVTDVEQTGLLAQAKRIGQETQFSNIDVVKAQTAAMQGLPANFAPGLKAAVSEGIVQNVRNFSTLMETDLKDGTEIIRGYLQQAARDISTKENALREANKATNQLVKMAKLGGMNGEDVSDFLKFGMSPAVAAGLSPEATMSLGALARRGGLRGSEAGVAVRSMASKIVAPTSKGIAALNAAGIKHSDFIHMPDQLSTGALEGQFQLSMGKGFTPEIRKRIDQINTDKALIADRGKYVEAVTAAVSPMLGRTKKGVVRASDAKVAAKAAGAFFGLSAQSVDAEGLLDAAFKAKMTLPQLNAWLTDKHGGKGAITQRQWDEYHASKAAIGDAAKDPDWAKKKADDVYAGLGGSIENFKGSIENAVLTIGNVNAPLIKGAADAMGAGLDQFSKMPEWAQQTLSLGGGAALTGASAWGTMALVRRMFGLGAGTGAGAAAGGAAASSAGASAAGSAAGAGAAGAAARAGFALPLLASAGLPLLATAAVGGALIYGSDHSKALVHGGRPTGSMNPSDVLPGLTGSDGASGPGRSKVADWWRSTMPTWAGGAPIPVEVKSISSGADSSGQVRSLNNTLDQATTHSTTAANGGKPIGSDTSGPIAAEVKSLPPLSGEVTGQATLTGSISVEPSQWFTTKISGLENSIFQLQGKVASIGSGGPGSTGKSSPDAGKGGRD